MYKQVHPSVSGSPIASHGENLATACVLCSHNCGLRVDVKDNRIKEVRADDSCPITEGYVCNKAFSIAQYVEHDQRVKSPLRRREDGSFEEVTWDEAIDAIGKKLRALVDRHGPRSVALVGVGGQGNHMDAPYALGWLRGIGSKRWFNAFAQEKTQHSLLDNWMFGASPSVFLHADDHHTKYLLIMGTNPRISNRGHNATKTLRDLRKDPEVTLVAVDPRQTETTRGADVHLQIRPGGDCYLLAAIAASIVQHDLHDAEFAARHVSGLAELRQALLEVDVSALAQRAGLESADVKRVACGFAEAESAAILSDLGVEHVPFSTLNAYLMRVVLTLTGNVGNRGGQVFLESFNPPDKRGADNRPTERALVSDIPAIRALGAYGMFSPSLFPEEVLTDHSERIRAVVVEGANPLLSFADTNKWRQAFDELDLVVVVDPAMTETARHADWVLPTPVGYEKWEISAFPKHTPAIHTQLRPPLVAGPEQALPEAEIYSRICGAMKLFGPPPRALRLLARVADRPRGRHALTVATLVAAAASNKKGGTQSRIIYWLYELLGPHLPAPSLTAVWLLCVRNAMTRREAVLRTLGPGFKWADPFALAEELWQRVLAHPEGVEIARLDASKNLSDNLGHPDRQIQIAPPPMLAELGRALETPPVTTEAFPFVLAAGLRTHWTANTIHHDASWRKGRGPHCPISLHPGDAEALGIEPGEPVTLETATGKAILPAVLDPRMQRGFVSVPNGFGVRNRDGSRDGVNLNELTAAADRDPFTGCPHHKHVACRVTAS